MFKVKNDTWSLLKINEKNKLDCIMYDPVLTFLLLTLKNLKLFRGVFKTQSNFSEGAFLQK